MVVKPRRYSDIKIRLKRKNGFTRIRTLITHPMETGRNKDEVTGKVIPAHFIKQITVEYNQRKIVSCSLGAGISKNPYFSFRFKGGYPGELIKISWVDNQGHTESAEAIIK